MAKIKVLHIIKSLGRGGAEMLLQETLKLHNENLFEFHYIYFLPWKNQMVEGIESAGGIVKLIPAKNNIELILCARKIIKYITVNKIDIVHCHLPWAGFVGRVVHKFLRIPLIYTEHNKQERYHTITKLLNKFTFNWQSVVIAVSNDVADSIQKNIHPKIQIKTILNGVDVDTFIKNKEERQQLRIQYNIEEDSVFIGTIAVFRFQKRLKEWITVFKKIHAEHPTVRGCIIGDGILKEEIMEHLKKEQMEGYIIFPGLQTNVIPWLSAIDIFMMTSEFEGLPIALLEAMSMSCAVVCTEAGGIKEVIRNGKDGFTDQVENWESLDRLLDYLIQNPSEIKNYGQLARDRVINSFSLNSMVQNTENLYWKILSK
jgi:glycosyltransferase involved in cell wall biosynthesis